MLSRPTWANRCIAKLAEIRQINLSQVRPHAAAVHGTAHEAAAKGPEAASIEKKLLCLREKKEAGMNKRDSIFDEEAGFADGEATAFQETY